MKDKIVEALSKLDASNDNHWTQDGLPRIDTLKFLSGGLDITREDVEEASPGFKRASGATPAAQGAAQAAIATEPQGSATTLDQTAPAAPPAPPVQDVTPPVPPAPPVPEVPVEKTKLEVLREYEVQGVEALNEALADRDDAIRAVATIQDKLDEVRTMIALEEKSTQGNPIQGYLAAQRRLVDVKSSAAKSMAERGIDLGVAKSVLSSEIDRAFNQRGKRGHGVRR